MQNQIPNGWQKVRLARLGKIVTGKTPSTSQKDLFGSDYPFITPTDIKDFNVRRNYSTERYLSDKWAKKSENMKIPKNSTAFVCIGSTIGKICLVNQDSFSNQQINSIITDKENSDPIFIYYLLKYNQKIILREFGGAGAAKPIINKSTFESAEVITPKKVDEQKKIASILSTFDDKIELNNKIAKTLEQMARAIFKEWFVKNKKSDWKMEKLSDLVNIKNGFAFKSADYKENGVPIVRTMNFTNNKSVILDDVVYLSKDDALKYEDFYLDKFDLLLVMVGASVGKIAITPSTVLPALQNQNMWSFKPINKFYRFYINLMLEKLINSQKKSTTGSARDFFRKDYFYSLDVLIPAESVIVDFNKIVEPMYLKIDQILGENQKLAQMRDLLLPKLMKGEIRV